ncbi:hypothetical protein MHY01S_20950 [Meiothermus hypogaeus NBRC 106114]|uniref:Uncharacterized protein n=1 Tax=Meiothermus hypogaeus NBRC 106114 TaxID=1227553 RepID=A0A511R2W9_9DEIN|nr:hypothetical protein MHY01S_20950 [Meiothermus hypogaeus NBRC 106114]
MVPSMQSHSRIGMANIGAARFRGGVVLELDNVANAMRRDGDEVASLVGVAGVTLALYSPTRQTLEELFYKTLE